MTAAFAPQRNVFSFQFATFDSCLFIVSLSLHDAGSQLSPIYRGVHLWRPCVLLYILSTLCSSYWVVSYCVKGRGVYFLASLQQPLEERIEIKITGRKASGSIKGCGPEEALASNFMAFWRTQELDGDEKEKKQASKGPKGRPGLGCLVGFWPPGARLAALCEVPPGFNGRCPLFEAKTSCRQNWTRSSSAEPGWIKQGLF